MKTVSKILSNFEKQVEELYKIAEARDKAVLRRSSLINDLTTLNKNDTNEMHHATRVAEKIKEIIQ